MGTVIPSTFWRAFVATQPPAARSARPVVTAETTPGPSSACPVTWRHSMAATALSMSTSTPAGCPFVTVYQGAYCAPTTDRSPLCTVLNLWAGTQFLPTAALVVCDEELLQATSAAAKARAPAAIPNRRPVLRAEVSVGIGSPPWDIGFMSTLCFVFHQLIFDIVD